MQIYRLNPEVVVAEGYEVANESEEGGMICSCVGFLPVHKIWAQFSYQRN